MKHPENFHIREMLKYFPISKALLVILKIVTFCIEILLISYSRSNVLKFQLKIPISFGIKIFLNISKMLKRSKLTCILF